MAVLYSKVYWEQRTLLPSNCIAVPCLAFYLYTMLPAFFHYSFDPVDAKATMLRTRTCESSAVSPGIDMMILC